MKIVWKTNSRVNRDSFFSLYDFHTEYPVIPEALSRKKRGKKKKNKNNLGFPAFGM